MKPTLPFVLATAFLAAVPAAAVAQNVQIQLLHGPGMQPGLQLSELILPNLPEDQ
jgi:hypothetical protein